jgi:hypothetical protein
MIPALAEHIAADTAVPPYEILVRGEGRRGACLELVLLESLIARGYHHDAALDTPVALAWWLHLARFDGEGILRLSSPLRAVADAGSKVPGQGHPAYVPEVLQAWGEAQQQRGRAGRVYDPLTDSPEAFATARVPGPQSPAPSPAPGAQGPGPEASSHNAVPSAPLSTMSKFPETGGAA